MGIQDREYYRNETVGSAWFSGVAPACRTIILINVAVFVLDKFIGGDRLTDYFSASSSLIFEKFEVWRLLTATFLHHPHNVFHLAMNMMFLWMVGREMESFYGTKNFVAMYVCAAIFSTLGWATFDYFSTSRNGLDSTQNVMVGASGAVMAVVVLYTLYDPTREVLLFFVFPVEMRWLLGVYLVYDSVSLVTATNPSTAFASQLTGALFGFLYKRFDLRWTRLVTLLPGRRPKFRVISGDAPTREYKVRPRPVPPSASTTASTSSAPSTGWSSTVASSPTPRSAPPTPPPTLVPEETLNARLDEILVKIAREGREGLSDDEKHILEEASRRARSRRSERI